MEDQKNSRKVNTDSKNVSLKDINEKSKREAAKKGSNKTAIPDSMPKWRPEMAYVENKYYTGISKQYRKLKMGAVICLIVFVLGMLTVFGKDITVENLKYLIKDFDLGALNNSENYSKIIYDSAVSSEFGFFKGDLAVVGAGSSNLYNSTGSSVFTSSNSFYSPVLLTSDKYFLVYDKGDTSCTYSVYNAFSELKTEKTEYPISQVSLSNDGTYAVVTRSSDYRGVVNVYNSNFQLVCKIRKDKYIMNVKLSDDGRKIVIVSAYDKSGEWCSEISLYDISKTEPDFSYEYENELFLKVGYFKNGGFAVYTDKRLLFFNSSHEEAGEYEFSDNSPVKIHFGTKYTAVAFNHNVIGLDKSILIFDESGKLLYESIHAGEVTTIITRNDNCFILFDEKVDMINIQSKEVVSKKIDTNCLDIVSVSEKTLLLCYSGSAVPLDFAEGTDNSEATDSADVTAELDLGE